MNSVTILLIGIPAAVLALAKWKLRHQAVDAPEAERADVWDGFEAARLNNPPLGEWEVR